MRKQLIASVGIVLALCLVANNATNVSATSTPKLAAQTAIVQSTAVDRDSITTVPDDVVLLAAHNPCADHSDWGYATFRTSLYYGAFYFRVTKTKKMDICTTAKSLKKPKGYKFTIVIKRSGKDPRVSTKTKTRLTLGTTLKKGQCATTKVTLEFTKPTSPTNKGHVTTTLRFCVGKDGGSSGPVL